MSKLGLVISMGIATGSSVVFASLALREFQPLMLVALRLLLATLAFAFTFSLLRKKIPNDRRTLTDIVLVGLGNMAIPMVCFNTALSYMSSGVLAIFLALIPLYTGLIAHRWGNEPLNRNVFLGLITAFAGVLVILATRTSGLASGAPSDLRGYALGLTGGFFVAFTAVYTRRRLQHLDALVTAGGQMAAAFLVVLPFALLFNPMDLADITWRGWVGVTYNGIIGSFVAFLIFFTLIKRFGATSASLSGYLNPLVSISLGALMLDEQVSPFLLLGAALTLLGVFIASRPPTRVSATSQA